MQCRWASDGAERLACFLVTRSRKLAKIPNVDALPARPSIPVLDPLPPPLQVGPKPN